MWLPAPRSQLPLSPWPQRVDDNLKLLPWLSLLQLGSQPLHSLSALHQRAGLAQFPPGQNLGSWHAYGSLKSEMGTRSWNEGSQGDDATLRAETSGAAPLKNRDSRGDFNPKLGTSGEKNDLKERGEELWKILGLSRDFQQWLGECPAGAVGKAQAVSHGRCEGLWGRGGNTPHLPGNLPSWETASA